ncbi:zinc ribbon domain-containing protein [Streptomyces sp. NPDC005202]|uniref:zinc ribbon domain-containing protein n=1 Tax=Streptomyces sp. NPDC005202 TaxID=3157021 RepID=UPI0033A7B01F
MRYALTGTQRCDVCGGRMTVAKGGNRQIRPVYVCYAYAHVRNDKAEADRALIGDLEADAPQLGVILAYLSAPHRIARLSQRPAVGPEEKLLRAELARLRGELEELEQAPAPKTARARIARTNDIDEMETEIAALEAKLSALAAPDPLAGILPTDPEADLVAWWKAADVQQQRAVAALLLTPELLGQVRVTRVTDSASDAVQDRLRWVTA